MEKTGKALSRRNFLKLAALGASAGALTACNVKLPDAPPATATPTPTALPENPTPTVKVVIPETPSYPKTPTEFIYDLEIPPGTERSVSPIHIKNDKLKVKVSGKYAVRISLNQIVAMQNLFGECQLPLLSLGYQQDSDPKTVDPLLTVFHDTDGKPYFQITITNQLDQPDDFRLNAAVISACIAVNQNDWQSGTRETLIENEDKGLLYAAVLSGYGYAEYQSLIIGLCTDNQVLSVHEWNSVIQKLDEYNQQDVNVSKFNGLPLQVVKP